MPTRDLTLGLVGSGGDGVVTVGELLALAGARDGLNVVKTEAYGPQIRGGESSCVVRLSADPLFDQGARVDGLVGVNWADFGRFRGELVAAPDAIVLYDEADTTPLDQVQPGTRDLARFLSVPLGQLARDSAGTPLAKNIVALGLLAQLFGLPKASLRRAVEARFARKKEAVREANLRGFDAGVAHALAMNHDVSDRAFEYEPGEPRVLLSGNEAVAIGALHAGCRFFAGYPITPSSEVLHLLSEWMPQLGGSVIQTEDELSAIGAVIGASFAGQKAMTSTSGPGLSLMAEMLGLATIAEVPAVILNVQRAGPSTGIPTKSEQSDLLASIWSSHGDSPRVVLAPSDVEDCFQATVAAFNIAEEYQVPVIVVSDQAIAQQKTSLPGLDMTHEVKDRKVPTAEELLNYRRYRSTESGVSPVSAPGMKGGEYQTNGLEHDEYGRPSSSALLHEEMNEKRYRKLLGIREQYAFHRRYGPAHADVGIVCWGSSKGAVKEAVLRAEARGERVAAFVPQLLYPFPKHPFEEFLASVDQLLVVELSYGAQFYRYLRTFLDLPTNTVVHKRSGGRNLTVDEVERALRGVLPAHADTREMVR